MQWLIDFDDTLVVGPVTWALTNVFPAMIRDNALSYDEARFQSAILAAQQEAGEGTEGLLLLDKLFAEMQWPDAPKAKLVQDVFERYAPTPFEDAEPFLRKVTDRHEPIYVVSNNNYAPLMLNQLGLAHYFAGIFTPKSCGEVRGKPQRDMWEYLIAQKLVTSGGATAIVGDDPWSDGAFADGCDMQCWIVDRLARFAHMRDSKHYHWVDSLSEIP